MLSSLSLLGDVGNTSAVDARAVDTRAAISQKVDTMAEVSCILPYDQYIFIRTYIDTE